MAFRVIVKSEKCVGCEDCLEACTVNVFEMKEGKSIPVHEEECIGCSSCMEVCKEKAITVEELKPEMSETARLLLREILSD
jgi:NAD-dependent dihydropyrimidine dehydrogenase PreA subunit